MKNKLVLALTALALLTGACRKDQDNSVKRQNEISQDGHGMGAVRDDEKSLTGISRYRMSGVRTESNVPDSVTLWHPVVGDQGSNGSCTGWAAATAATIQQHYQFPNSALSTKRGDSILFNPEFIWRYQDYNRNTVNNCPAAGSLHAVIRLLRDTGACQYESMKLYSCFYPTDQLIAKAQTNKIKPDFTYITPQDSNSVQLIKDALLNKRAVVWAGYLGTGFPGKGTPHIWQYDPTEGNYGGHAMTIIGYNNRLQAFLVQNQWGGNWADKGLVYMSYKQFGPVKASRMWNLYVISDMIHS